MSDYQIIIKPSARKSLNTLPLEISTRINAKILSLASNPRPIGCLKLTGKDNNWRIRVGDYRVIYTIDDNSYIIDIKTVRHRREIYDR
jgi:mRNA interferase RelE/StbE